MKGSVRNIVIIRAYLDFFLVAVGSILLATCIFMNTEYLKRAHSVGGLIVWMMG